MIDQFGAQVPPAWGSTEYKKAPFSCPTDFRETMHWDNMLLPVVDGYFRKCTLPRIGFEHQPWRPETNDEAEDEADDEVAEELDSLVVLAVMGPCGRAGASAATTSQPSASTPTVSEPGSRDCEAAGGAENSHAVLGTLPASPHNEAAAPPAKDSPTVLETLIAQAQAQTHNTDGEPPAKKIRKEVVVAFMNRVAPASEHPPTACAASTARHVPTARSSAATGRLFSS
jgi:hypothetical protein